MSMFKFCWLWWCFLLLYVCLFVCLLVWLVGLVWFGLVCLLCIVLLYFVLISKGLGDGGLDICSCRFKTKVGLDIHDIDCQPYP